LILFRRDARRFIQSSTTPAMMKKTVRQFSKSGIMKTDLDPHGRPMHGPVARLKSGMRCSLAISNSTVCHHDDLHPVSHLTSETG
jgi:hypothetical protein